MQSVTRATLSGSPRAEGSGIDPVKIARKLWKDTHANKAHDRPGVTQPPLNAAAKAAAQRDLPLSANDEGGKAR
jgi:hypothetical protein